jgi:hypothetical protein
VILREIKRNCFLNNRARSYNSSLASAGKNSNFLLEARTKLVALHFQVEARLEIQPEPIGGAKIPRKPQRGIGADRSLPQDDLIDPTRWHAESRVDSFR